MSLVIGGKTVKYLQRSYAVELDCINTQGKTIYTGVIPTNNTIMDTTIERTGSGNWLFCYLGYGAAGNYTANYGGYIGWNTQTKNVSAFKFAVGDKKHLLLQKNTWYVDGTLAATFTDGTWTGTQQIYLGFGRESANYFDIYETKFWEDATLIRDFVPCKLIDDLPAELDSGSTARSKGTIGMWDTVSNKFYCPSSTGMTAGTEQSGHFGKEIQKIEINGKVAFSRFNGYYDELTYIQSSGTQYIDSGFNPTGNSKVSLDFQVVSFGTTASSPYFGEWSSDGYFRLYSYSNSTSNIRVQYANTATNINAVDLTTRNILTLDGKNAVVKYNDTTIATLTHADFTTTRSIYLLMTQSWEAEWLGNHAYKCYGSQIYDNGTLVRDFVPCKLIVDIPASMCADSTKSHVTGDIGMWDKVNDKFYANAGTGTFIAG